MSYRCQLGSLCRGAASSRTSLALYGALCYAFHPIPSLRKSGSAAARTRISEYQTNDPTTREVVPAALDSAVRIATGSRFRRSAGARARLRPLAPTGGMYAKYLASR
jgi:hypothetical protein